MTRPALTITLIALVSACGPTQDTSATLQTHVGDWRDEVIYQILVDRFANGDPQNDIIDGVGTKPGQLARFQGGDWRGIEQRLGYIQRLGATTIWISPIVDNVQRTDYQDGYHGYWAADFTRINRRFGSLSDLRSLVRTAHRRGVKVIIDVVTNHAGRLFFYDFDSDGHADPGELEPGFSKTGPHAAPVSWMLPRPQVFRYADRQAWRQTLASASRITAPGSADPSDGFVPPGDGVERLSLDASHFHRRGQTSNFFDRAQKLHGDFPTGLRDLHTENEQVIGAMVDTYLRWVELTDVDGFRLDAVPHVPQAFWARFARELRAALAARGKHRFILLGEVFDRDPKLLASYTREGGLDAVFDFSLKWEVVDAFLLDGWPAADARGALEGYRAHYPSEGHSGGVGLSPWQARVSMMDNHDMQRLRRELDDPFVAELAMTLVFTVDAIPSIYYGTEQELVGAWGNASREVLWEVGYREHTRMYKHIAKLAKLRKELPALRRGGLVVRYASPISARQRAPGAGLLAYERALDDDAASARGGRALVALNGHPIDHATAKVPTGFNPGTLLRDLLGEAKLLWRVEADGRIPLSIPPRRAVLLVPAR
jgi:alpha-amylase